MNIARKYVEESLITIVKSIRRLARSQIVPSIIVHHREILSEKTFFLSTFFVLYSCFYFASTFPLSLLPSFSSSSSTSSLFSSRAPIPYFRLPLLGCNHFVFEYFMHIERLIRNRDREFLWKCLLSFYPPLPFLLHRALT